MTRPRTAAPPTPPSPPVTYIAAQLPSGDLLRIEARVGRRVLRTIEPHSAEGRRLLAARRVEIVPVERGLRTDH